MSNRNESGALAAFDEFAARLRQVAEGVKDAFVGIEYRRSRFVRRGEQRRVPGDAETRTRTIIYEHPLDAIRRDLPRDYIAQSNEVAAYFAEAVADDLDTALAWVNACIAEQELRQAKRMAAWMDEHGVTQLDLDMAHVRARWARRRAAGVAA